uniref:Uncharacterized protein n=1 Tax=Mantoniella antarctica TaxID=81844 RepID=A0A7S0S6C9_9CHLO
MSGKKIRGRTNRAKLGEAAVQPPLATPSALHEPPGPHPLTQRGEIDEEATAAPTATRTYTLDRVTRAQLATKLQGFTERSLMGIHHKNQAGLQLAALQMTLVLSPSLLRGEMKKPCSLC